MMLSIKGDYSMVHTCERAASRGGSRLATSLARRGNYMGTTWRPVQGAASWRGTECLVESLCACIRIGRGMHRRGGKESRYRGEGGGGRCPACQLLRREFSPAPWMPLW